jgi:threonine dehydrogenase-like Zn-dependent dehydrogenase
MRGVVLRKGQLVGADLAEPVPGEGQLLLATKACGICGTDLHARKQVHGFFDGLARSGTPMPVDPDADIVMGHEFCGEVIGRGPGTGRIPEGALVVGLPYVTGPQGAEYVGYSNRFPGGFAEQVVVTEKLMFVVPEGLTPLHAALTEPLAVGAHAVARADPQAGSVVMVVGCGPIGLAVIAALKARGIGPVVGLDFSRSRLALAEQFGADEVVDAGRETQADVWARLGAGKQRRAVVFECVGRPGIAQQVIEQVPKNAAVIVVGNALGESTIDQVIAFNREIDLLFSVNYTPREFGQTLEDLASGRIDARAVLSDVVGPDGVAAAFEQLADPTLAHAKIVVSFT